MTPVGLSNEQNVLFQACFSSVYTLMALQLVSRLFTFCLNQAMLRMASPRAFGTAAIQFELLVSTVLFLSRDGVRNALLRARPMGGKMKEQPSDAPSESQATSNLSRLPFFFGLPLTVAASWLYRCLASVTTRNQPHFDMAVNMYALAIVIELLSEPLHNRAMGTLRTDIRVRAEGMGVISKAVVTFLLVLYDSNMGGKQGRLALLAFAGGQLSYGIVLSGVYLSYYCDDLQWALQCSPYNMTHIIADLHPAFFKLSITMTLQSFFKHLLTEGDKLLLSWLSPLEDQAGYAVAVNYGSLVARIIFQPIEESLRLLFSKIPVDSVIPSRDPIHAGQSNRQALRRAIGVLMTLLNAQFSLGIIFLVFGTAYMPIALRIVLPPQYLATSAPSVLGAWVWYLPILAINGGLEAFFSSVATPRDLNMQSRWMAAFSAVYLISALIFYRLGFGDVSLVYANIINLLSRIAFCLSFIRSFLRVRKATDVLTWKDVAPRPGIFSALVISKLLIECSARALKIPAVIETPGNLSLRNTTLAIYIVLGGMLGALSTSRWWILSGQFATFRHK